MWESPYLRFPYFLQLFSGWLPELLEQRASGPLHARRGLGVAHGGGDALQRVDAQSGPEELLRLFEPEQFFQRGPPVFVEAAFTALGIDAHLGLGRRTVVVDVGVEEAGVELVDRPGVAGAMCPQPMCLRITAAFLVSTRPLSPEWRCSVRGGASCLHIQYCKRRVRLLLGTVWPTPIPWEPATKARRSWYARNKFVWRPD